MKHLFLLLAVVSASVAQSPFVREGSIGQAPAVTNSGPKMFGTLELEEWVNQKFILLPQRKKFQQYGYQSFRPALPYDQWAGKILTVTNVDVKGLSPKVTFVAPDGQKLEAAPYAGSIENIGPLRDLEYARSNWVGKALWFNRRYLSTWDEARQEIGNFDVKRFSPVHVEDVVAGEERNAPVRFILKTSSGEVGFVDVNVSGTNIPQELRDGRKFADTFFEQEPPELKKKSP